MASISPTEYSPGVSLNASSLMTILLKLKHWQIFLLGWGIPIILNILSFNHPNLLLDYFPLIIIFYIGTILGWIWGIGTKLNEKLPPEIKMNKTRFQILLAIPILYMIFLFGIIWNDFMGIYAVDPIIIIPIHFISTIILIWSMIFAAKTLKSVELKKEAKFSEYVGEFFLISFSVIGFWILQPRINSIIKNTEK